jgi:hypothetical protein
MNGDGEGPFHDQVQQRLDRIFESNRATCSQASKVIRDSIALLDRLKGRGPTSIDRAVYYWTTRKHGPRTP